MKAPYLGDRLKVDRAPEQAPTAVDRVEQGQAQHSWEVQAQLRVVDRANMQAEAEDIAAATSHIVAVAYKVVAVAVHRVAAYPGHSRCIQTVPQMVPQMILLRR